VPAEVPFSPHEGHTTSGPSKQNCALWKILSSANKLLIPQCLGLELPDLTIGNPRFLDSPAGEGGGGRGTRGTLRTTGDGGLLKTGTSLLVEGTHGLLCSWLPLKSDLDDLRDILGTTIGRNIAYGNVSPLTTSLPQGGLFAIEAVLSSGLSCMGDAEGKASLSTSVPVID
jgi:hypothetical protein